MRVKLYRAPTLPEAMAQIRAVLGAEAMILSTRRISGGVEVTAALEEPEEPPAPPVTEAWARPDRGREATLAHHGVPTAIATRLANGPLPFALSAAFRFRPLDLRQGAAPLLLVGPPGAGKTLSIARLATRLVLAGQRPRVLTTDVRRAGAYDQLAAFTSLLGLKLGRIEDPSELAEYLTALDPGGPTVIDSAGLNPFDLADRRELTDLAGASRANIGLVLPAGLDPGEAADLAAAHADVGASLLLATRLDVARRLGGILAAASVLPLSEAGIGPGAADGMVPMTPALLAKRLERTGSLETRVA